MIALFWIRNRSDLELFRPCLIRIWDRMTGSDLFDILICKYFIKFLTYKSPNFSWNTKYVSLDKI